MRTIEQMRSTRNAFARAAKEKHMSDRQEARRLDTLAEGWAMVEEICQRLELLGPEWTPSEKEPKG